MELGPEQMVVVGYGKFSNREYDLGIEKDIVIPATIQKVKIDVQKKMSIPCRHITPLRKGKLYGFSFSNWMSMEKHSVRGAVLLLPGLKWTISSI